MLMAERRVRQRLGRLVSMLVLGLSIGTVMPVHAQSNLRSLWLAPQGPPSSDVWVKCARTGMTTDHGVKLLIAPDLGSECEDILQKSYEYSFCLSGAGHFSTATMSPRECYGWIERLRIHLPQPEVLRGNWLWRLEKPSDVYLDVYRDVYGHVDGFFYLPILPKYSATWPKFHGVDRKFENAIDKVLEEVQEIVNWAGDIWHIDRDVDGRAARIIQSLWNDGQSLWNDGSALLVPHSHDCPVEEGGTWYTVGEDGMSVGKSPTVADGQYVRIYQDPSNKGYERRVCVPFLSESDAVRAVERLVENVEEGLISDAGFWKDMDGRIRGMMSEDFRKGVPFVENSGVWLELWIMSTKYQRPHRTLTLQSTGETIQLWIGKGPFVKVRWINMPAESWPPLRMIDDTATRGRLWKRVESATGAVAVGRWG